MCVEPRYDFWKNYYIKYKFPLWGSFLSIHCRPININITQWRKWWLLNKLSKTQDTQNNDMFAKRMCENISNIVSKKAHNECLGTLFKCVYGFWPTTLLNSGYYSRAPHLLLDKSQQQQRRSWVWVWRKRKAMEVKRMKGRMRVRGLKGTEVAKDLCKQQHFK